MDSMKFASPVRVFVGLGMPRDLQSPFDAYAFLRETPCLRHRALHERAASACLAALQSRGNSSAARAEFLTYAQRAGILADNDDTIAGWPTKEASIRIAI